MKIYFQVYTCVLLFLIYPNTSTAQNNDHQAVIYNMGLGAFVGAIGAVINKKPQEKTSKVFLKGFWQGSLGGFVTFQSKKMIYGFAKSGEAKHAWGSKIVNSVGTSIVHNAASNLDFWEKMYFNFAFNRLEFDVKNNFKVHYQIMPTALFGTIATATQGTIDFESTLKTGHLIFKTDKISSEFDLVQARGYQITNNILIQNGFSSKYKSEILAHEIIHIYQYTDFSSVNPFFNKPKAILLNNQNKLVQFYRKWFYTDFNHVVFTNLYSLQGVDPENYYGNFFESEADYYSSKRSH